MSKLTPLYKGHRFPPEIIQYAVWLYYRFNLSHRDIEDLMAERGIIVSYESIRLWCNKFGPQYSFGINPRANLLAFSDDLGEMSHGHRPGAYHHHQQNDEY